MSTIGDANHNVAVLVQGVKKSFGGVHALREVNLTVRTGTIHAVVGENGAGKSTLMNVLAGIHQHDSGKIEINGVAVNFQSPRESIAAGVAIIHQELALAPDLSVAENMFLGDLGLGSSLVPWGDLNKRASDALKMFGFDIAPTTICGSLSVAYQQVIEIAKCLAVHKSRILILDEPTAVLADPEIDVLFDNLRTLRNEGVTIIYISHRLEEIFRIADKITVVKDGQTVTDLDPKSCTEADIITNMVGRPQQALFPLKAAVNDEEQMLLETSNLTCSGVIRDINIRLRRGEIVGLAGLVGSGRSEVARAIFGIDSIDHGTIKKNGVPITIRRPSDAITNGIALVPEDRKRQGGVLQLPIAANITMANRSKSSRFGVLSHSSESAISQNLREKLRIKLGSIFDPMNSLSGGNQQKVVLAKWLNTECDVLLLDEPTRGVDVGAKAEIYAIISDLAKNGFAILVISSELVEIVGLCNRVYVMSDGEISGLLEGEEIAERNIMRLAIPKRKNVDMEKK